MSKKVTISLEPSDDNPLVFLKKAKENAKRHKILYHCTDMQALLSIVKNKEFWLTNLSYVNDKDEKKRIDLPEYENSIFVCCFTYNHNIPIEHWKEYSSKGDGVLFSVKQDWFKKDVKLMTEDNKKIDNKVFQKEYEMINNNPQTPLGSYFIRSFDFFEVVYDDSLKQNILNKGFINFEEKIEVSNIILPSVAGIIKTKQGICNRTPGESYLKD